MDTNRHTTDKYSLMHLNTPSYSSSVVTWDCAKLTPITYNRVIKWLGDGNPRFQTGEAASMYNELRRRFELPDFTVTEFDEKSTRGGYIRWSSTTPRLYCLLNNIYQAERVTHRLKGSGWIPWYLRSDTIDEKEGYFYTENPHDLTEIKQAIQEITHSEQMKQRREDAVAFVKNGGKLTFTY
jgi:hypothetical protein